MSKKPLLLFFVILLAGLPAVGPVFAQASHSSDAPDVRTLRGLYLQAGLAFPTAGFPVSTHTLAEFALDLAAWVQDPALRAEIENYLRRLGYEPGEIEIAIVNRFTVEAYLRAGGQAPSEVVREYLERPNLWELVMAWSIPDRAGFLIEAFMHREYLADLPPSNLPAFGLPGNPVAVENDNLARGLFWYNFDPLQLRFGRDRVHFGPLRSSLLPSSRIPYLDMLRLTLPLGSLTMDYMISSLSNRGAIGDLDPESENPEFAFNRSIIFANMHRFEYHFGRLHAAVTGLGIFVRPNNAFALADFFPVASWHSIQYRPFNLSLVFDLEAALFPGFRVMTQFGFDDVSLEGIGIGDAPVPTIPAVIAGFEYRRRLGASVFHAYAEGGYTHYLWGNFDDESGAVLARAIYRLFLDRGNRLLPLTSPYGPGVLWVLAEAGLEDLKGFSAALQAELVYSNPDANLIDTPYFGSDPALGDLANKTGFLSLAAELGYEPSSWFSLYARPKVLLRQHQQQGIGFELALGASALLDWRRRIEQPGSRPAGRADRNPSNPSGHAPAP